MKIEVECEDSVVKEISGKDVSVGIPVYVPKKWFLARGENTVTVQLLLLPKKEKTEQKNEM
jgi:hypothetical protein